MSRDEQPVKPLEFEKWIPLAQKVVRQSLALRWNDVLEVYSYIPTISLAEALALEGRRAGSDTHITLMTDDLWFTSMKELSARWLRSPSHVEIAINKAITASIYLGGPRDARRMRGIPPEKFDANSLGNVRQDEPLRKRRVRHIDLPIGRLCPERAEAYGLDYGLWRSSYEAALAVNLDEIRKAGEEWRSKLKGRTKVKITSDAGTDLTFETKTLEPMIEDGIVGWTDRRRGFVSTSLPAGKIVCAVQPASTQGKVRFTDPVFLMGRSVKGLRLGFEKGGLVDWGAGEHAELLTSLLGRSKAAGDRMGWFSIGLNSAAEPCMLDNSIVRNDVGIGLGPQPLLEPSKVGARSYFDGTIGRVNVEVLN
jgi:leucyl aminopeptidase (aminopeptidase T)